MLDAGCPRHIPPTCVNFLPRKRQQPLYPLGMNDSSLATLPRIVVQLTAEHFYGKLIYGGATFKVIL